MRKNWTKEEIEYLRVNYEATPHSIMALFLKRSRQSVRTRLFRLGYLLKDPKVRTNRNRRTTSPYNFIMQRLKSGAKSRNLEFNITENFVFNLVKKNCFYCGIEPKEQNRYKSPSYKKTLTEETRQLATIYANGIDRVDNNIGYTDTNCVSCCFKCNQMKLALDKNDFINQCINIAKKHSNL